MHDETGRGALDRALLLRYYIPRYGPVSPAKAAEDIGICRSATYRLIKQLRERGYLEAVENSDAVRIGVKVVEMGLAELGERDIVSLGSPYLRDLAQSTQEVAFLGVVDSDEVVYLARENAGAYGLQLNARLGVRRPLHATALGKAFMSALPCDELLQVLARLSYRSLTPRTITDPELLQADIEATKQRGHAVDDVEGEAGVGCFAAPVLNHVARPVCAISVAGPAERLLPKESTAAMLVMQTAQLFSRRLGHRP